MNPSWQGKSYSIWTLAANYLNFPLGNTVNSLMEPGLRMTSIITSWSMIESFVRECLTEQILRRYDEIEKPEEWKYKLTCWQRIKNLFKNKLKVREEREIIELHLKTKFANYISNDRDASWNLLTKVSKQIGYDLEQIPNSNWSFMKNLYHLRNGLVHGKGIKILQSNSNNLKDDISKHYVKSINFLNNKNVISKSRLISTKNIDELLNKNTTDYIIQESYALMDEIKKVYHNTFTANQW